ncbi:MAG: hypothetical protein ABJA34_12195, partial [Pseudonocardiales bacterium]
MDKRVAGGTAQPMVLVMLHPTLAPPHDTECVNVPHRPQVETDLAADLPAAVGRPSGSLEIAGDGAWPGLSTIRPSSAPRSACRGTSGP